MNWRRPWLRALLFLAVLVVFLAPWTGLDRLHAAWFRLFAEVGLQVVAVGCSVDVRPEPAADAVKDTAILVSVGGADRGFVDTWGAFLASEQVGYLPLVLFVSLVLVTPLAARRRWRALVLGTAILHGFLFLRLLLFVVRGFQTHLVECPVPGLHTGLLREHAWVFSLANGAIEAVEGLMYYYAVPVLVWLAVTARHADWKRLVPRSRRLELGATPGRA